MHGLQAGQFHMQPHKVDMATVRQDHDFLAAHLNLDRLWEEVEHRSHVEGRSVQAEVFLSCTVDLLVSGLGKLIDLAVPGNLQILNIDA